MESLNYVFDFAYLAWFRIIVFHRLMLMEFEIWDLLKDKHQMYAISNDKKVLFSFVKIEL